MQTSTPQNNGPKGLPSILLRGAPGAHKTTLALQFPGVCILDCDENMAAPEAYIRNVLKKPIEYKYVRCRYDDKGVPLKKEDLWPRYVAGFNEAVADPDVRTIVTDSLTGLDQMLLRYVMDKQGLQDAAKLERQHWIPFRMAMQELSLRMRQTGKINVVCAHENSTTNKAGEVIKYDTALTTKLRENFGWIFTDIWFLRPQPPLAGKVRSSIIETSPSGGLRPDLKNSFLMPPEVTEDWATLNTWLKLV